MKPFLATLVLAFFAAAETNAEEHDRGDAHDEAHAAEHSDDDGHVAEAHGLRVLHPWTRAADGGDVLVWFEIENRGETEVTLTGGASPVAGDADVVGYRLTDGAPTHEPLGELSIDAGGRMQFEPRGLALRLHDVTVPLEQGESFVLELETSAGPLPMTVLVESASAEGHSHAGHSH